MAFLDKLLAVIKISIKVSLTYIADMWSTIIVSILEIIIFYYIWMAVYSSNTSMNGINKAQIITYIILSRILYMQIAWGVNLTISNMIENGKISMELLRPLDFQLLMYLNRIGDFISSFARQGIPALIVSIIIYGISLPQTLTHGLVFILSTFMAVTLTFLMEFIIGLVTFYTMNGWGLQIIKMAVFSFFSGSLIPLAFFPTALKSIVNFLPFKDMVYTPISIYIGLVPENQFANVLMVQLLWILSLFVLARIFFNISIKKVTVQGG